jgi:hypothetical protein
MTPMTVQQLLAKREAARRLRKWVPWRRIAPHVTGLGALTVASLGLGHYDHVYHWPDSIGIPVAVAFFVVMAAIAIHMAVILRRRLNETLPLIDQVGLRCPACGKDTVYPVVLTGIRRADCELAFPMVLAGGRCGECGAKIVDYADHDAGSPAPRWSHAQLVGFSRAYVRLENRLFIVSMGIGFIAFLAALMVFDVTTFPAMLLIATAFLAPVVSGGLGMAAAVMLFQRAPFRRVTGWPALACPSCGARLFTYGGLPFAVASGRCSACGHRVCTGFPEAAAPVVGPAAARDPQSGGPSAPPLLSRCQAAEIARTPRKLGAIGCLALLVHMVVFLPVIALLMALIAAWDPLIDPVWQIRGEVLALLLASSGFIAASTWLNYRADTPLSITCPSCNQRNFIRGITLATGRCMRCGERLVAEE